VTGCTEKVKKRKIDERKADFIKVRGWSLAPEVA